MTNIVLPGCKSPAASSQHGPARSIKEKSVHVLTGALTRMYMTSRLIYIRLGSMHSSAQSRGWHCYHPNTVVLSCPLAEYWRTLSSTASGNRDSTLTVAVLIILQKEKCSIRILRKAQTWLSQWSTTQLLAFFALWQWRCVTSTWWGYPKFTCLNTSEWEPWRPLLGCLGLQTNILYGCDAWACFS